MVLEQFTSPFNCASKPNTELQQLFFFFLFLVSQDFRLFSIFLCQLLSWNIFMLINYAWWHQQTWPRHPFQFPKCRYPLCHCQTASEKWNLWGKKGLQTCIIQLNKIPSIFIKRLYFNTWPGKCQKLSVAMLAYCVTLVVFFSSPFFCKTSLK